MGPNLFVDLLILLLQYTNTKCYLVLQTRFRIKKCKMALFQGKHECYQLLIFNKYYSLIKR